MWYRFAEFKKPIFLKNPFDFSFWVCVSSDCKEPIENPDWIEIKPEFTNNLTSWTKLLRTETRKINTREKLSEFLKSRIEDYNGKIIYKSYWGKKLKNEMGEFYIDGIEKSIKENESHNIGDWSKLLRTDVSNINTQEKLTKFLESKIRYDDDLGKRIYKSSKKRMIKLKNEIGEFYIEGREESIKADAEYVITNWKKLLSTNFENINTQEKLTKLLESRTKDYNGKKIYKPYDQTIVLKNEMGEFSIDGESIKADAEYGVVQWSRLLRTNPQNINNQEKLTKLLRSRITILDNGKQIYEPFKQTIVLKNEMGEFYIDGREESIKQNDEYGVVVWAKLLRTNPQNINNQEKLTKLLRSRIIIDNGKRIYKPFGSKLKNEIGEFYIDGIRESIKENEEHGINYWTKLLRTDVSNINTQEKLTQLLRSRIIIDNGKRIYKPFGSKLKNEIGEFYIEGREESIKQNEEYVATDWIKLLRTELKNINTQEKLTEFLKINIRQIDEKNIYIPSGASYREKLLRDILESSIPEHNFTILYNKTITIFYNPDQTKIKLLRFDSVIYDNEKPILFIEIHGSQHYKYVPFDKSSNKYNNWQKQILNDIIKMNYCYDNQIPIIYLNHYLSYEEFKTICNNIKTNPHFYDQFIPGKPYLFQKDPNNNLGHVRSYDFENDKKIYTMRLIHSHFYPIFSGLIDLEENRLKTKIKDTLISIAKLVGLFESNYNTENFDNLDYIKNFNYETNLTENYNYCVNIFNELFRDKIYIDFEDNITYKNVSEARNRKLFKPTVEPNISEENSVLAYNIKILRI